MTSTTRKSTCAKENGKVNTETEDKAMQGET